MFVVQAHHLSVNCIHLDAFKLTTAGTDGTVKIFDISSSKLLKTLNSRYFRQQQRNSHQEEEIDPRWSIRCMISTLHQVLIGVGNQVKCWDVDPDRQLDRIKGKSKKQMTRNHRKSITSPQCIFKVYNSKIYKKRLKIGCETK